MTAPASGGSRRALLGGLVRYATVGVANAAVYYGVYLATLGAVGYLVAHVVGLGTAMVASFFLNCRFTFRVRPTWMRFLLYPASQAVNIVATTVGVVGLVHAGVDERIAPLVAAVLAVPASFLVARLVMLRSRPAAGRPDTRGTVERALDPVDPADPASLLDAVTRPLPTLRAPDGPRPGRA